MCLYYADIRLAIRLPSRNFVQSTRCLVLLIQSYVSHSHLLINYSLCIYMSRPCITFGQNSFQLTYLIIFRSTVFRLSCAWMQAHSFMHAIHVCRYHTECPWIQANRESESNDVHRIKSFIKSEGWLRIPTSLAHAHAVWCGAVDSRHKTCATTNWGA